MNKIILLKPKVMIVKILLVFITFSTISCSIHKDLQLLDVILKENVFQKEDSLYLVNEASNKLAIDFFNLRNREHEVVYGTSCLDSNKLYISKLDSLKRYDETYIVKYKKLIDVTRDQYLKEGKGISKIPELFLKDSFDISESSSKWNLKDIYFNVYPENHFKKGKKLVISKPVYNKTKKKAIIFLKRSPSESLRIKKIYMLEKKYGNWKIVFQQERKIGWLLDKKAILIE